MTLITYRNDHPADIFAIVSFLPVNGGACYLRVRVSFSN